MGEVRCAVRIDFSQLHIATRWKPLCDSFCHLCSCSVSWPEKDDFSLQNYL